MIFPSRETSYKSSVIPKMIIAMELLSQKNYKPNELFKIMEGTVVDVSEFLNVMDCLYLLGEIELDVNGEIKRVVK